MTQPILYGFPRSTYVNVARLALLAKGVEFQFHDTETEMYTAAHQVRHPFGRVPALQHGDFWLYETSAIALYVDEAFPGPPLQPADTRRRALGRQWMSNLSAYYYPYMVYHLVHERLVFADLGITADEAVVAEALPKIERGLQVLEDRLRGSPFLADDVPTLADYFFIPTLTALGFTPEGQALLLRFPAVSTWFARLASLPAVERLRATLPPRAPIEHARRWVLDHRPVSRRR
jgi:glutathione S-transferase